MHQLVLESPCFGGVPNILFTRSRIGKVDACSFRPSCFTKDENVVVLSRAVSSRPPLVVNIPSPLVVSIVVLNVCVLSLWFILWYGSSSGRLILWYGSVSAKTSLKDTAQSRAEFLLSSGFESQEVLVFTSYSWKSVRTKTKSKGKAALVGTLHVVTLLISYI